MEQQFDIWRLLAGLGIFLFGMFLMEESIKNLAGRSFKKFIRKSTRGRLRSIASGTFVTAILQSSSAVSLMVLAFVGAGIMPMANAIGVIIGSNVGTTFTAWIVATFGFQLQIEAFSLPFIGIGGLGIIFLGKSTRYSNISKLLVGFGFLFMGLDYMKQGVEVLTKQFNIASLPDYGLFFYLLVGIILTAIMQSSSATIAVVLTALNAGILGFEDSAAMVIGANIGTTVTILLGVINAGQLKKRVGMSHLLFNLGTGIIGLLLLPLILKAVGSFTGSGAGEVIGVAMFHTLFNLLGVIVFTPFIPLLVKLLEKIIPEKKMRLTAFIENVPADVSDAAVEGLRKEVKHLIEEVLRYNLHVLNIDEKLVFAGVTGTSDFKLPSRAGLDEQYKNVKLLQAEISTFAARVHSGTLSEEESLLIGASLNSGRIAMQAAKIIKDVRIDFDEFENADSEFLNDQYVVFRRRLIESYMQLATLFSENDHEEIVHTLSKTENKIQQDDKRFMKSASEAVSKGLVSDINISTIFIVNRAFVQSSNLLLEAMRELLLEAEEIGIMESVKEATKPADQENNVE